MSGDVHAGSVKPNLSTASEKGFHVPPISLVFSDAVESLVSWSASLFSVACRVWIEIVAGCRDFLLVDELLDNEQKAVGSRCPRRRAFDEAPLVWIIIDAHKRKRMEAVDAALFALILPMADGRW